MRAIRITFLSFCLVAAVWAVRGPLLCYRAVRNLDGSAADCQASENLLRDAGPAATRALRAGLVSPQPRVQLRCARLLALRGEAAGEEQLATLREHGADLQDPLGGMAEAFLAGVWEARGAPNAAWREKLARLDEKSPHDSEVVSLLSDCLAANPAWTAGYVRRGRIYQRNRRVLAARRDALIALLLEPDDFEAMQLLAEAQLGLDAPEQAYVCLRQALRVNPRMKAALEDDLREASQAIERQRKERREEVAGEHAAGVNGKTFTTKTHPCRDCQGADRLH